MTIHKSPLTFLSAFFFSPYSEKEAKNPSVLSTSLCKSLFFLSLLSCPTHPHTPPLQNRVFLATLWYKKPSALKFIWVQRNLEGFIITYLLAEADLAVRFYPRPIDLVRMFTPEVTGRASICIRPWARFFPPLIGLSMSAPCLLTLITLFFSRRQCYTEFSCSSGISDLPEEEREPDRERRRGKRMSTREGTCRSQRVGMANFRATILIILSTFPLDFDT